MTNDDKQTGISIRFVQTFNHTRTVVEMSDFDHAVALVMFSPPIPGDTRTPPQQFADALEYVRTHREQFP